MGQNDKLLDKMRRKPIPNDITMQELNRLLLSKGFELHSQNSAHLNYKHHMLKYVLTIDSHNVKNEVKSIYIKLALNAIDEIEGRLKNE